MRVFPFLRGRLFTVQPFDAIRFQDREFHGEIVVGSKLAVSKVGLEMALEPVGRLESFLSTLDRPGLEDFALQLCNRTGSSISFPKADSEQSITTHLIGLCQQDERMMKAAQQVMNLATQTTGSVSEPVSGQRVGPEIRVRGSVVLRTPNLHAWIAHFRDGLLWPKEPNLNAGESGDFDVTTCEGGPSGELCVKLLVVDEENNKRIQQWIETGQRTGEYPGLGANEIQVAHLDSVELRFDRSLGGEASQGGGPPLSGPSVLRKWIVVVSVAAGAAAFAVQKLGDPILAGMGIVGIAFVVVLWLVVWKAVRTVDVESSRLWNWLAMGLVIFVALWVAVMTVAISPALYEATRARIQRLADNPRGGSATVPRQDHNADSTATSGGDRTNAPVSVELHFQHANESGVYHVLDKDTIPLTTGDRVQIHVKLSYKAFPYLFYLSKGQSPTLVYPPDGRQVARVDEVWVPAAPVEGQDAEWFTLAPPSGTDLVLLLVADTPVPDLQSLSSMVAAIDWPDLPADQYLDGDLDEPHLHTSRSLSTDTTSAPKGMLSSVGGREWRTRFREARLLAFPHVGNIADPPAVP